MEVNNKKTIAIIDAELIGINKHRFPNLVCMKISGYYKELGNDVKLVVEYNDELNYFDKIFLSKVFTDTQVPEWVLNLNNIEYGGTGFFYDKAPKLPYEIEHHMPDYHLYDDWVYDKLNEINPKTKKPKYKRIEFKYYLDYSIGFMTRGCFRQCQFCVNKNYNMVSIHSPIEEFLDDSRPKICLLDDNALGCKDWKKIFESLQATKKPFQFKQGLDERILTEEKILCLKNSKYDGDYIFAFDNIEDKEIIIKKAELIRKHFKTKGHNFKFYVLCAFDRSDRYDDDFWIQDIKDTFERIFILSKYNFKPYIMRFAAYNNSPYYGVYVNFAHWCNQPNFFFNYSLRDFCIKYDDGKGGRRKSAVWTYLKLIDNEEFKEYIETKPKDLIINYWDEHIID